MIAFMYSALILLSTGINVFGFNQTKACELCHSKYRNGFSTDYKDSVARTGKDLWNSIREVSVESESCSKDFKKFLINGLGNSELWALKMLDATGKFPSGILSGNLNQLGDFDECLSIKIPISGKYCLASLDFNAENMGFSSEIDSLIHAHRFFKSNLTDISHRIPRISTIYWGFCIPSSCSSSDLEKIFNHEMNDTLISILAEEKNCVINENIESNAKNYTILFFVMLCGLSVLAPALLQFSITGKSKALTKFLEAFNLKKNLKKFLNVNSSDEAKGVDGMRALCALGLLLGHKSVALFFSPYINKTTMAEKMSEPWTIVGRTAVLYTDTFILISGYLTARTLFKDLKNKGYFVFSHKLINRVFRILPTLASIIFFCTYILPELGNGPMWDMVVTKHSRLCKKNMWTSFLFIHNYMGFENMCLTHTHQLGIDMQLFLFAPIAVIFLWKSPRNGIIFSIAVMTISTILRYVVTIQKNISTLIYFGMSVKTFFDTANFSYILPTHRATIYLMGVLLAYFMTLDISKIKLNKLQNFALIAFILPMGLIPMIGPWHTVLRGYEYNNVESAIYSAFSPISWGLFNSWLIWACSNNSAGFYGDFLSWKGFKLFTKISLGVYLTQFPLFFYNIGRQKHSGFYVANNMFDLYEISIIVILSSILAIFIEIPFSNVAKWLIGEEAPRKEKLLVEENNNAHTTDLLKNELKNK